MSKLQLEKARIGSVDRGPDWLFVRLQRPEDLHLEKVADQLWELLNKHFIYRLVLEMDDVEMLPSQLIGQLIMLQKRVLQHDGALRLCGLSSQCEDALRLCRLDHVFPNFDCRSDAVYGSTHPKPR
ncbi:MAG: STAS domain-containing protein [Planctomycetes bacterium]|nr:STAS domain-containing protein [Planctomycetota bacterium]